MAVTCRRSGRKHDHTWPDGRVSTGYLVVAGPPIPGTRSSARWTAGFAAQTERFGRPGWVVRDASSGELLVSIADRDRSRDNSLTSCLIALELKIDRGDIQPPAGRVVVP